MPLAPPHPLPGARVSFEDFLADPDCEGRFEWVDGEVLALSPASLPHQRILGLIYRLMMDWPRLGGTAYLAPCMMRLPTRPSGREPDLLFLRTARAHLERANYIDGPADLVVEIVSPESERRDRVEKRAEYERAGIEEYWILDPAGRGATFLRLGPEGRYLEVSPDADGIYRSPVIGGMPLPIEWLKNRTSPSRGEIDELFRDELARIARVETGERPEPLEP